MSNSTEEISHGTRQNLFLSMQHVDHGETSAVLLNIYLYINILYRIVC